jgi:hypothetical protein
MYCVHLQNIFIKRVTKLEKDVFVTARIASTNLLNTLQGEANVYLMEHLQVIPL